MVDGQLQGVGEAHERAQRGGEVPQLDSAHRAGLKAGCFGELCLAPAAPLAGAEDVRTERAQQLGDSGVLFHRATVVWAPTRPKKDAARPVCPTAYMADAANPS